MNASIKYGILLKKYFFFIPQVLIIKIDFKKNPHTILSE